MSRDENERPAAPASANRANQSTEPYKYSSERSAGQTPCSSGKPRRPHRPGEYMDFAEINRAALAAFPAVLARILPGGKRVGSELVALNPHRADRHLGWFKVNLFTGKWADFASGDRGGDPVSLVAYVADVSQSEAARLLARMLGLFSEAAR